MKVVKFTVYGEPKAKGRPRVSVRKSADGDLRQSLHTKEHSDV